MNVDDVLEHTGLVRFTIRKYGYDAPHVRGALELEDLIQWGMIGLMRATRTWDPAIGSFATHGIPWIRSFVGRAIMNESGFCTRIPCHEQERRRRAGKRMRAVESSLNVRAHDDGETTVQDLLESPEPDDNDEPQHAAALLETLIEKTDVLSERERFVVARRRAGRTLQAIADEIGVTRERVRQIEVKALRELRRTARMLGVTSSAGL